MSTGCSNSFVFVCMMILWQSLLLTVGLLTVILSFLFMTKVLKVMQLCVFEEYFTTLYANSADNKLIIFFLFSLKIGFDNSYKLSP